jgi:hypothetical protein
MRYFGFNENRFLIKILFYNKDQKLTGLTGKLCNENMIFLQLLQKVHKQFHMLICLIFNKNTLNTFILFA